MTLTEQEIDFFKQAKRIQELWEPKFGDRVCDPEDGNRMGILAHPLNGAKWQVYWLYAKRLLFAYLETLTFLPRPDQLWEMLEERGHRWDVGKLPDSYTATIWNNDVDLECEGPTPSIALGKCLLEVMGE